MLKLELLKYLIKVINMTPLSNNLLCNDNDCLLKNQKNDNKTGKTVTVKAHGLAIKLKVDSIHFQGKHLRVVKALDNNELQALKDAVTTALHAIPQDEVKSKLKQGASLKISYDPQKKSASVNLVQQNASKNLDSECKPYCVKTAELVQKYNNLENTLEDSISIQANKDPLSNEKRRVTSKVRQDARSRSPIRTIFKKNGKTVGMEQGELIYTISTENKIAKKALSEALKLKSILIAQLNNAQPSMRSKLQNSLDRCKAEIKHYIQVIKNIREFRHDDDKEWVTTNNHRDKIDDYQNYDVSMEKYIPTAVNMWAHSYISNKNRVEGEVIRLGVISDMRNGWFSLKFLKMIKEKETNPELINAIIQDQIEKILKELCKHGAIGIDQKDISFVNKKLEKIQEKIRDGKLPYEKLKKMYYLQSARYAIDKLLKIQNSLKKSNFDLVMEELIGDRRRILRDKMLQLVTAQISRNPLLAEKENVFEIFHQGLLNGFSRKLEPSGWMHDEAIEIEDMAEIFSDFNGKKMIFDSSDPYEDLNGDIHMPAPTEKLKGQTRELNSYFINISPQVNTRNSGIQRKINDDTLMKLESRNSRRHRELEELNKKLNTSGYKATKEEQDYLSNLRIDIESKEREVNQLRNALNFAQGGYKKAEEICGILMKFKNALKSIGCFGAKDRTSEIATGLIVDLAKEKSDLNLDKAWMLKNGVSAKINEQNGGFGLKIIGRIPNVSTLSNLGIIVKGFLSRIKQQFNSDLRNIKNQRKKDWNNRMFHKSKKEEPHVTLN